MTSARGRRRVVACCVGLLAALGIARAAPLSVANAFRPPSILWMRLSGDGKHLAAFVSKDKAVGVVILDRTTLKPKLLRDAWTSAPRAVRWVGKDVLAVITTTQTHLFDGEGTPLRRVDGRFLGSLTPGPDGHERIVVADERDAVERVDVRTGASTKIPFEWPDGKPVSWLMDREGVPRVATTINRDRTFFTHWVRGSANEPWQKIESQLAVDPRWQPVGLAPDGRSLIVLSAEGRDTAAVMRYSLQEHALKEVMAGHPTEDIGNAVLEDGDDRAPDADVGNFQQVVTLGMKTEIHWFDPKWAALQRSVDVALPRRINWLSGSFDSGTMLIFSTGDVDPGTWYLLDLATMSMRKVDSIKPEIDRAAMRPMQIVSYKSLDGREIPAYLTLPAGSARNLPAIVLVHGGPIVRDQWAWNAEVQMLASRGYAVLQPQFRGSRGFGKAFEIAGYGQWGRTMQDDITAGAEWLVAQGLADPHRMCIYGGSYGGYATLWALVKTPKLFRCGASLAGVSDPNLMFSDDSDMSETESGRLFLLRYLGTTEKDPRLDEVSPLKNAARIEVPVLLAHGNLDKRVPIVHSEKMMEALRTNDKTAEWLYLRGEKHGFTYASNVALYYRTLFAFLARNTGSPDAAPAPSPPEPAASEPAKP